MTANKIYFKRGIKSNLPTLSIGEPALTTDTEELFIGGSSGNIQIAMKKNFKEMYVNVLDFGAKGDGVHDDTQAIKDAISYAQSLVTDRFLNGVNVRFPKGTFLITSTITITSSNIWLEGMSISESVIYAPSSNFDLIHFDGTALSLYGCGMSDLRIYTPTNSTSGKHLKCTKMINSIFQNLYLVGWYDGINLNGCGRVYFDNIILSQENRTSGSCRYGMDFTDGGAINSDVHFDNIQIVPPVATSNDYIISIRNADGIYFENLHMHGGVLIQPNNTGFGQTLASVFFSNCYFDTANDCNFSFSGTATTYRNFKFSNCYFRGAKKGLTFNTTSVISKAHFVNCEFTQQQFNGVEFLNTNSNSIKFVGCTFAENNTDNNAVYGDILSLGTSHQFIGCDFIGGGALGNGIYLKTGSVKNIVSGCTFTESTAVNKLLNSGSACKIGTINGVVAKNIGSATIASGTTSIVVTHGIAQSLPMTLENILVTPRGDLNGGTYFWISTLTATTFTINVKVAPTVNVIFTWVADVTV